MTRFWITLDQGVHFVLKVADLARGGEIFVPKIPTMNIMDLAKAVAPECETEVVGIRPGEKIHETLIGEDEGRNTIEYNDCYVIRRPEDIKAAAEDGTETGKTCPEGFVYASNNEAWMLDVDELREILAEFPMITPSKPPDGPWKTCPGKYPFPRTKRSGFTPDERKARMTTGSFASPERAAELKSLAIDLPSVILDWFQLQDYELLASGITAPLSSYAGRSDYESVLESMRLADGRLMPLPVCLRIDQNAAREIESSKSVALRDEEGYLLAVLHASEIWQPDMDKEARALYGVVDCERIGVSRCLNQDANLYCSGDLEILDYPVHYDFSSLRPRPDQVKNTAADLGWNNMVGFITASPIHKPQFEMTRDIMDRVDAGLLLMPIVGSSRRMEVGRYTRVRCYKAVAPYYPDGRIMMSLLPLSMRLAGPREALWQAMIARNFGCTHFIVRPWQSSPEKKGNATVNGIGRTVL